MFETSIKHSYASINVCFDNELLIKLETACPTERLNIKILFVVSPVEAI